MNKGRVISRQWLSLSFMKRTLIRMMQSKKIRHHIELQFWAKKHKEVKDLQKESDDAATIQWFIFHKYFQEKMTKEKRGRCEKYKEYFSISNDHDYYHRCRIVILD